jgi:hypothetical protein
MSDRCSTCKARVRWAIMSDSGRPIPLDYEPVENGNIQLAAARVRGGAPIAVIVPEDRREKLKGSLYVAHFATCPDANEHRRPR